MVCFIKKRNEAFPMVISPWLFRVLKRMSAAILASILAASVFAQCAQSVKMADYRVCVPAGWNVQRNDKDDSVELCNRADKEKCAAAPFDDPYPGAVVLNVIPSDRGYGIYRSPEDLNAKARKTGQPLPSITDVVLDGKSGGAERKCWLARTLVPENLWTDVYSLSVGGRRFRVSVAYNNEAANVESFRKASLQILTSIAPLSDGSRPPSKP
jgi:hypothetical protein